MRKNQGGGRKSLMLKPLIKNGINPTSEGERLIEKGCSPRKESKGKHKSPDSVKVPHKDRCYHKREGDE